MSDKEIASRLGITRSTLSYYRSRGCTAKSPAGVQKWKLTHVADNGPPTLADRANGGKPKRESQVESDDLEAEERRARIRKLDAEAEAKELKNSQLRGELYDANEVEADVAELTGRLRVRLESIPDELQTEWPAEVRQLVTERLADKIHLILTELSQWRLSSWDAAGDSSTAAEEAAGAAEEIAQEEVGNVQG